MWSGCWPDWTGLDLVDVRTAEILRDVGFLLLVGYLIAEGFGDRTAFRE
jgi:hypothetical protein